MTPVFIPKFFTTFI